MRHFFAAVGVVVIFGEDGFEFDEVAKALDAVEVNPDVFPEPEASNLVDEGDDAEGLGQQGLEFRRGRGEIVIARPRLCDVFPPVEYEFAASGILLAQL